MVIVPTSAVINIQDQLVHKNPYQFLVGNSLAQESGSRVFQTLNDYIYTGGGDLSYNFNCLDKNKP